MKITEFVCWRDASHKVGEHPIWGWPKCTVCDAAPPYYERRARVNLFLDIVVVTDDRIKGMIAPGSGVVARQINDGRAMLSYEGFIHGGGQGLTPLERYRLGLLHAADRLVTDYPTIATLLAPLGSFEVIGLYDPNALHQTPKQDPISISDQAALDAWLQEA